MPEERKKISYHFIMQAKLLDPAEINYNTTEKELLAIVFALDKFRSNLIGTKVICLFRPFSSQASAVQKRI